MYLLISVCLVLDITLAVRKLLRFGLPIFIAQRKNIILYYFAQPFRLETEWFEMKNTSGTLLTVINMVTSLFRPFFCPKKSLIDFLIRKPR